MRKLLMIMATCAAVPASAGTVSDIDEIYLFGDTSGNAAYIGGSQDVFDFSLDGARASRNRDGIADLGRQVRGFKSSVEAYTGGSLAVISAGTNDVQRYSQADTQLRSKLQRVVRRVARSVRRNVVRLDRAGVTDIAVVGLPGIEQLSQLLTNANRLTERAIERINARFVKLTDRLDQRLDANVEFVPMASIFEATIQQEGDGDQSFFDDSSENGDLTSGGGDTPSPVPLPAGGMLLLSGLAGFGMWSRRRKSQA